MCALPRVTGVGSQILVRPRAMPTVQRMLMGVSLHTQLAARAGWCVTENDIFLACRSRGRISSYRNVGLRVTSGSGKRLA